jgi:hypothetical protein
VHRLPSVLASKIARNSNKNRETDYRQAPHLETVGLKIHSIKGHTVAGLLHRAQVQEGVLGLGPNSSRGPVIQSAGGDSGALLLGVCCHGARVCHDGIEEGGQLGLAGLEGEVAHVEALGSLGGFLCCSLQQVICSFTVLMQLCTRSFMHAFIHSLIHPFVGSSLQSV